MNRDTVLIEADALLTALDDPNIRLYDATILFYKNEEDAKGKPTAYEKYLQGHIPGAAFFDHQNFSDATSKYPYTILPEADLARQIGNIGITEDSDVIVYSSKMLPCATRAWWMLRYAGHNNVRILNGGLAAWEKAGGTIEREPHTYPAARFDCHLRPQMLADKTSIQAATADDGVGVVNSLSLESYENAHIPGSSCLPCGDLMQDWMSFLPNDELASRLKHELPYERVITYCGGGIAATVNAIAHLMAGNKNVAVYDGSMYEWTGEGLPITQGGKA